MPNGADPPRSRRWRPGWWTRRPRPRPAPYGGSVRSSASARTGLTGSSANWPCSACWSPATPGSMTCRRISPPPSAPGSASRCRPRTCSPARRNATTGWCSARLICPTNGSSPAEPGSTAPQPGGTPCCWRSPHPVRPCRRTSYRAPCSTPTCAGIRARSRNGRCWPDDTAPDRPGHRPGRCRSGRRWPAGPPPSPPSRGASRWACCWPTWCRPATGTWSTRPVTRWRCAPAKTRRGGCWPPPVDDPSRWPANTPPPGSARWPPGPTGNTCPPRPVPAVTAGPRCSRRTWSRPR